MKRKNTSHLKSQIRKTNQSLFLVCFVFFISAGCTEFKSFKNKIDNLTSNRNHMADKTESNNTQNAKVLFLSQKLKEMGAPQRVELRSYIKDYKSRYKQDIEDIRKLKVKLDYESSFYIEINLFTDETSLTAPLVARIMKLDIRNSNLIEEVNYNLE